MGFRFGFDAVTFSDGTRVSVPPNGALVLVGPNNSGKSAALRELLASTRLHAAIGPVIRSVEVAASGSEAEFSDWFEARATRVHHQASEPMFQRLGLGPISLSQLRSEWTRHLAGIPAMHFDLTGVFVFYAAAEGRLALANGGVQPHDPTSAGPASPLQALCADEALERRISELTQEAFRVPVTLGRVIGSSLSLRLGEVSSEPTVVPTVDYLSELQQLPLLEQQGDGFRSYVGLLLAIVTGQFPLVLVDEPEAFLHPPQARLLGKRLITEGPPDTQIVVATHSVHILQGLLDARGRPATVARLVRKGEANHVAVLEPEDLRELWADPILRYSGVLEGLFHRGVVVTEGDADSRFYAAVLDAIDDEQMMSNDLFFTQAGGKARLPVIARALRAVSVPVAVIADFDVLRDEKELVSIVEALAGSWDEFEPLWRQMKSPLDQMGSAPSVMSVKEEIENVLSDASGTLSRALSDKVRSAVRLTSGWEAAKRAGISAVPQGAPAASARKLLAALREIGLFVVPVGELERWVPDVPGHGPRWVSDVLEADRHREDAHQPREFVSAIVDWIARENEVDR